VLQTIASSATLIERRAEQPAAVRRFVRLVSEAADRGAATTRRLLAFARRSELRTASVEPKELLSEFREILRHSLGAGVIVEVSVAEDVPLLLADRAELETVLVNLATNARDAMPDGGTLRLAAQAETIPAAQDHPSGLAPGAYVRIDVADTGTGMDATTLAHASEPFFTTKPVGKGTGLGLSMARGFAQQSGGALTIASTSGVGTTVTLWLPQADASAAAQPSEPDPQPARVDRRPTVLLVDDDPLVRESLASELQDQGFRVAQADGGPSALARLDTGETVDLLVTDLSMAGMDGVKLVQEAKRRRPNLPAIIVTGYAGDAMSLALSGALGGAFTLLRKPVTGLQIADRAATLLESPHAA
jgi:CheY-like chemotaxis protein